MSKNDAVIFTNSILYRDFMNYMCSIKLFYKNWNQFSIQNSNFIENLNGTDYIEKPTWRPKNEILA